jgi:phage anti-repressor protein
MDRICKKCGLPVKKYYNEYDVFEGMHWICFHFEFEHGSYDLDEPCDDPSCPWNAENRELMLDVTHDLKIVSSDSKSWICFDFFEKEAIHCPSICFSIQIKKNGLLYLDKKVWFKKDILDLFIKNLNDFCLVGKGQTSLESMSPNDLILSIETIDKAGHVGLFYKTEYSRWVNNKELKNTIHDCFEIEFNVISNIIQYLMKSSANICE